MPSQMWREKKTGFLQQSPFCTFLFDSIHVCFSSCANHSNCAVMMSLWPRCVVINRVCQCPHSNVFPFSHQCKSGLHHIAKNARTDTLKHKHTHTHTLENLRQCTLMHLATGCSHQQKGNGCILRSVALTTARRRFTVWRKAAAMHAQPWLDPPVW